MGNILDPCQISPISSGLIITVAAITALQVTGFCLPVLDYVKFTAICILMYFYYEIVIKTKPPLCGTKGLTMWSSICSCVILCTAILAGLCVRFKEGGEIAGYGLLIFCVLPYTLCCIFRLYSTKGPLSGDFWNPKTITKIYI